MSEIDRQIQYGRTCIRCGEKDYPLSLGGPDICPACDCGNDVGRIKIIREQIRHLESINMNKQILLNEARKNILEIWTNPDKQAVLDKSRELLIEIEKCQDGEK